MVRRRLNRCLLLMLVGLGSCAPFAQNVTPKWHCRENLFQAHGEQDVDFPLTAPCGAPLAAETAL